MSVSFKYIFFEVLDVIIIIIIILFFGMTTK